MTDDARNEPGRAWRSRALSMESFMSKWIETKTAFTRGAVLAGITGALVLGGATVPATSLYAEAVRVDAANTVADFADVVEAVSPAVVSVKVEGQQRAPRRMGRRGNTPPGLEGLPEDHPFRKFFERRGGGQQFGQRRDRREQRRRRNGPIGQGSGFFVSGDGYIVTNNHVVAGGKTFTVVTNEGKEIDAKLIGTDPRTDLAVLKVEGKDYKYVDFGVDKARVGQWVVAVGNPFGLGGTVTAGIVSAAGRDIGAGPYDDFLQIDAAVNRGNSGGPAFNLSGEVIGVNTAIFSPSGGNVGIAFAISAKTAKKVVSALIKDGEVTRGWLGVSIEPVTKDIAEAVGIEEASGAIVSAPQEGSPAAKAGLRPGDVIVAVDEVDVSSPKDLARIIASYAPDAVVDLAVVRAGEEESVKVTLGKLPAAKRQAALDTPEDEETSGVKPTSFDEFGLELADSEEGVVVSEVAEGGVAEEKRLAPGDIVLAVNSREVTKVREVGKAVAEAMEDDRKAILFQVKSGERSRFVALPVNAG